MSVFPQGAYTGDLVKGYFEKSKNKGTPCICLQFTVNGETKYSRIYLTDKSWDIAQKQLEFVGWNGDVDNPQFSVTQGVPLWNKIEQYEGADQEKWSISTPRGEKLDKTSAQSLASKWRARTGRSAPKPTASPPPKSGPPTASKPPASGDMTKDQAWAEYEKHVADPKQRETEWFATIAGMGKPEESFTASDWGTVGRAASLPL